ncbi:MAG: hypothetical protein CR997_12965 [Acidobacteria bacterium]|nr:MAG: hypothetical protein CR997_12965 [Acidobacteriota bacterium]
MFDFINIVDHSMAEKLHAISKRLDSHPEFINWVYNNINPYEVIGPDTGCPGMSADRVLLCAILKAYTSFPYCELESHLNTALYMIYVQWTPIVEKTFGNIKAHLGLNRLEVSAEKSLDGTLFVEFIVRLSSCRT